MPKNRTYFYLAYGSNLNMGQMSIRCKNAYPVGKAMLKGYQLAFRGSGSGNYLTIDRLAKHQVPVVVWRVDDEDVKSLNRYEGFPVFYTIRRFNNLKVESFIGEEVKLDCFAYIMIGERTYGMPSFNYLNCCEEGYSRFGIDQKYLDEALEYTKGKMDDSIYTRGGNTKQFAIS